MRKQKNTAPEYNLMTFLAKSRIFTSFALAL